MCVVTNAIGNDNQKNTDDAQIRTCVEAVDAKFVIYDKSFELLYSANKIATANSLRVLLSDYPEITEFIPKYAASYIKNSDENDWNGFVNLMRKYSELFQFQLLKQLRFIIKFYQFLILFIGIMHNFSTQRVGRFLK